MRNQPKRVAVLHHAGGGNLGDIASMQAVICNIKERWPDSELFALSMNPEETSRHLGIPSFPLRRYRWASGHYCSQDISISVKVRGLLRWLVSTRHPLIRLPRSAFEELAFLVSSFRRIRAADELVVSGGGQLTERGGPWSFPYTLFIWALMAKRVGARCTVLNVGAGPLNGRLSRFFIRRALCAAHYVSFRDEQSQNLGTQLGYIGCSVISRDNVYSLQISSPSIRKEEVRKGIVGFNPMYYPFNDLPRYPENAPAIQDDLMAKMATFAALLARQSYTLELFGTDVRFDPPAIDELREMLLDHGITIPECAPVDTVGELLTRMAKMDYIITCRYHGVIFAHLLNKPVLAIAHHPKVTHLMQALGMSDYCVEMLELDPNQLVNRFTTLVSESDNVKERMAASLVKYRSELETQFDCLFTNDSTASKHQTGTAGLLYAGRADR